MGIISEESKKARVARQAAEAAEEESARKAHDVRVGKVVAFVETHLESTIADIVGKLNAAYPSVDSLDVGVSIVWPKFAAEVGAAAQKDAAQKVLSLITARLNELAEDDDELFYVRVSWDRPSTRRDVLYTVQLAEDHLIRLDDPTIGANSCGEWMG